MVVESMDFEVYYQSVDDDEQDPILEFSAGSFEEAIKFAEKEIPSCRRAWVLQLRGEPRILSGARADLLVQIRAGKAKFKKGGKKRHKAKADSDRGADEQLERVLAKLPES
jgi:hypothetical protein